MSRSLLAGLLLAGCGGQGLPDLPAVPVPGLPAEVTRVWRDYAGVGLPSLLAVLPDGVQGRFVLPDGVTQVFGVTSGGASLVSSWVPYSTAAHELYHQALSSRGLDPDPDHLRPEWPTLVSAEEGLACQTYGRDPGCPTAPGQF
jgi:hypothetical protein